MISVFSSKLKDLQAWNNCTCILPTFVYLCLNKFWNLGQYTFMGSREWYHYLDSLNNVTQNLWTFTPLTKPCAFIQSFEQSRCASASSSVFPENSGLKFDQFKCKCCCFGSTGSWTCCCCCCCFWFCYCWFCCCCCHWLDAGTPSSLSAIFI